MRGRDARFRGGLRNRASLSGCKRRSGPVFRRPASSSVTSGPNRPRRRASPATSGNIRSIPTPFVGAASFFNSSTHAGALDSFGRAPTRPYGPAMSTRRTLDHNDRRRLMMPAVTGHVVSLVDDANLFPSAAASQQHARRDDQHDRRQWDCDPPCDGSGCCHGFLLCPAPQPTAAASGAVPQGVCARLARGLQPSASRPDESARSPLSASK